MTVGHPDAGSRWRCSGCGNLTRFDVARTTRVREYWHQDLAGAGQVERTEVLADTVERVSCRWCGSATAVELVPCVAAEADAQTAVGPSS